MKLLLSLSILSLTIVLVSCGTGSSSSKNEIDDTIKIYQTNSINTSIKIEQIRISSDTLIMYNIGHVYNISIWSL